MEPTHRILLARIFQLFSNPRNKLYYLRVLNTCSFQCWPLLMWIPFGKGFHICSMDPPQKTTYIPQIFHQKDWVEPLPKGISTHIYIKPKKTNQMPETSHKTLGGKPFNLPWPNPMPTAIMFFKTSWSALTPFGKRFEVQLAWQCPFCQEVHACFKKHFEPCHTIDNCKNKHMMKWFDDCWC